LWTYYNWDSFDNISIKIANAFGSTFAVFPNAQSQAKNCKRATKPTHNDTTMDRQMTTEKEERRHNTGLAKVAVQWSADTFVVNQSLVLRINICGENRHLRQARKRYSQA
jgi:hypothetical protein